MAIAAPLLLKHRPHFSTITPPGQPIIDADAAPHGWRPAAAGSAWFTFDTGSPQAGEVVHHATLVSNEPVAETQTSYVPLTQGVLELSISKTLGNAVTVAFAKVKSACAKVQCGVRAIFDETQPEAFPYAERPSKTSTILALGDFDRFIQRLAVSHDLTLIARLGPQKDNILSFTVAGYQTATRDHPARIMLTVRERPAGQPFPG